MEEDVQPIKINGVWYVYIDEECIVSVRDLLEFARDSEKKFNCWRKVWSDAKFVTERLQ